jgi:hypothetical protein
MRLDRIRTGLRLRAREAVSWGLKRYGYALVREGALERAGAERVSGVQPDVQPGSESIPRGRQEPFSTLEYDVLPRDRFDVVRRDYYSPIPNLPLLPRDIWTRRSELHGVSLDADGGIEFVERALAAFIAELDAPLEGPVEPGEFFIRNTGFESVDAELLYGMVRHARPSQVIELGSGYTTLVINLAARRNIEGGVQTNHVAYDPYPREHVLGASLPEPSRLEAVSATEVPLAVFEGLEAGDILFVDTTHTVKLGSDVNFIVLEVLPRLRPGVIIHFHDIFLPWEYPRAWFEDMHYYWAEQYLVQAFLAFNPAFTVLVAAHAIAREHRARLGQVIPSFEEGVRPGSLWLRREGADRDESRRAGSPVIDRGE